MISVAIIEDDGNEAKKLREELVRYGEEHGEYFDIKEYRDAESYLNFYKPRFDIVFMDIELNGMNGMEAARRLRGLDSEVILIFVTNMRQFACEGYAVEALDFIVKPILYSRFCAVMARAVTVCRMMIKRTRLFCACLTERCVYRVATSSMWKCNLTVLLCIRYPATIRFGEP